MSSTTRVAHIATELGCLAAELTVPADPVGVIAFARTNAARRPAFHDQQLAQSLHAAGFATLLFDLLTPHEELVDDATLLHRFDLALLSRRLIEAIDWLATERGVGGLPVGVFGEGPGAAAAFVAACVRPYRVAAVVSSAGRLDLASPVLPRVQAPCMIIASGINGDELRSNAAAFDRLRCPKQLVRVASDPYTTTGDHDAEVSWLALDWFVHTMAPASEEELR
jgi:dienelactone hydrolase